MITPSFSLTAVERVLPKLTLDFTTASLDSRITFTRSGSTATRVNSSGYIETVAADTPRFDFNPVTLACKGLLIEEQRTNIFTQGTNFSSGWLTNNVSLVANTYVSPDGTTNATKLNNTVTGLASRFIYQNYVFPATGLYTMSAYAKADTVSSINFFFSGGYGNATFNLSTGQVQSVSGLDATASITPAGNGYYRCVLTANTGETGLRPNYMFLWDLGVSGDTPIDAGLAIYGAQLEAGAFATSYIPTEASQVTRNADVATMTGTNFSSWFNVSEGSAVIQILPSTISGTRPAIQFDDNTANEIIALRGNAADPQLYIVDGGAAQATLDAGTLIANATYKLGGAWKTSSFAASVNGNITISQLSGTYPTTTQARLGSDGSNYLNGWLQNLRYWPQRIIDAEAQSFSK